MQKPTIGYIGLGTMGAPMAKNLLDAGYTVHSVKHRSPTPTFLIEKGIVIHDCLSTLSQTCEVIFTNLPDTPDVEQVIFGDLSDTTSSSGLLAGLKPGTIIIDNSTISPEGSMRFAKELDKKHVHFVDAPVSGGLVGAEQATLTIMVGANQEVFANIEPILKHLGRMVTRIGNTGAGQICKAANQVAIAGTLGAVAEALVFAQKNAVDPAVVRQVLLGGAASSRVLELQGERMVARDFSPKFTNRLYRKDLNIVLEDAKAQGIAMPITAFIMQLLNTQRSMGLDDQDTSALIRVIELMSGIDHSK